MSAPIEVAFFFDAPDAVIANVIRDMGTTGQPILVRLIDAPLALVTSGGARWLTSPDATRRRPTSHDCSA